jgi:hypothetical protein
VAGASLFLQECHESLVLGQEDAERQAANESHAVNETTKDKEMRKCAQRELLGIGQPNAAKRPLRVRRSTWGLTGTPLLSSETRITELAALCAGTYVTGSAAHWRMMERASTRDVFLRYHESASSLLYLGERTRAAQAYISTAVQRNKIDTELKHIKLSAVTVPFKLGAKSEYARLLAARAEYKGSFAPPFSDATDAGWADLQRALAAEPSRQQALRDTIDRIHEADAWTKVVVFAPGGAAFDSAHAALKKLGRPILAAEAASDGASDGASVGEKLDLFSQRDEAYVKDASRPLVLLMSFDQSSALNLQKVSHNVIFYAPLWGEDADGVHASSNEQQALGRVIRTGQPKDVVLHRIVAVGPAGQKTIEDLIIQRNTSKEAMAAAVNT